MPPPTSIQAFQLQNLLLEFTALKTTCPPGLYLSLAPTSRLIWHIAFFPRAGPYIDGVYAFVLEFPRTYPSSPPKLRCTSKSIAHPLVDPQTGEVSLLELYPSEAGGKKLPPIPGQEGAPDMPIGKKRVSVLELLKYLKRVFEDEEYIKRIPNWAVRDGKATRAWRDGKGKEVLGLGIVDGDGEEGEVIRFVDMPPDVKKEVFAELGIFRE